MLRLDVHDVEGDLLEQNVQALVNPWNRNFVPRLLLVPCGVSGQLKKRTGPGPWRELARRGTLSLGQAVVTGPGSMKGPELLIHVAGLTAWWRATTAGVESCAFNAVDAAVSHGVATMAMPLIGAGTGGLGESQARAAIEAGLRRAEAGLRGREHSLEVLVVHRRAGA